jgi:pimeloyl-ACP methyl ester carboxylesterase
MRKHIFRRCRDFGLPAVAAALLGAAAAPALAADIPPGLKSCRLQGVEHEAWCGSLRRPLDPAEPQGRQIELHYAVLPALARNKKPDPVMFFAGGPGQSAIALAGPVSRLMARLSNRRDVVLVDQRGTGRSAPLVCDSELATRPLAEQADAGRQLAQMRECRDALQKLPHGDLRRYTTTIAMQDADAVRQALGVAQLNLVGGSYGTRAALEYMRQFPQSVRRVVIDGIAPPDMVLPASFSPDAQSSFDAVLAACEGQAACRARYPTLRADWQTLLRALPREVTLPHPVTGAAETLTLTRDMVLGMVRQPLYVPSLASALPLAVSEAARGRFAPLLGLSTALSSGRATAMAAGMHYSVVCAEDGPRIAQAADRPGADFGAVFAEIYARTCAFWPRGDVPAAFYTLPSAPAATLLLSGGADPATPPRHGERVAKALGAKARHVVVAQAGHGVMGIGCMRDVIFRFIDAASDDAALKVDADCAAAIPRPVAFVPVSAEGAASAAAPAKGKP